MRPTVLGLRVQSVLLCLGLALWLAPGPAAGAALAPAPTPLTFTVNDTLDALDAHPGDGVCQTAAGGGVCTLRAAVIEANAHAGADTILVPAGLYTLTRVGYDDSANNGDLDLLEAVTIIGAGLNDSIITANGLMTRGRVFQVHPNVPVVLADLQIRDGRGPAGSPEAHGAGIANAGTLVLERVEVIANQGDLSGGIYNTAELRLRFSFIVENQSEHGVGGVMSEGGKLRIEQTHFTNNVSGAAGGGLWIGAAASAKMWDSSLSGNQAGDGAGILLANAQLTMRDSVVYDNHAAGDGGGISLAHAEASLDMVNSTIYANTAAGSGGGLNVPRGVVSLYNVTLVNNKTLAGVASPHGGGLRVTANGTLNARNSLIANNWVENGMIDPLDNCLGVVHSQGYNLFNDAANCTLKGDLTSSRLDVDPLLDTLANYDGPTLSIGLLPGSPAIDAGNPAGCFDQNNILLLTDQRGYVRSIDGSGLGVARCDAGAFEAASGLAHFVYLSTIRK